MSLTPGTLLGTYEILSPLGAGGMGEVYRARDTRLGREVAVKVLPEDVAASADRLARFEREARTVAGLNHPNIVTLFSVEDEEGTRFLTMELVDGESLDRLVTPGGVAIARVLDLAIPLADALVAAHERGVVHRDLKPGNVMVTREGRVKVLDFGLAKLTAETKSDEFETLAITAESPISGEGQVLGTVPYMAPEQVRGETVDARTDLFALGILLYELSTGERPFAGATSADLSSSILRDSPEPLTRVRSDLPVDLERIIGRCLEKNPRDRLQTALDVSNELRRLKKSLEPHSARAAQPATQEVVSIGVLPFVNRSRDEEDEYFSDGLADELLSVLAKIRGLRVAARTSSSTFKGKDVTIAEVGQALNVASVLEGSVRKAGNRVRISVQLVNVADGYHLWSETYDRTLDDIFAVQDDIAQSVVKELRRTLLGEDTDSDASREVKAEVAAAAAGRSGSGEVHRLYLQGKHFVDRLTEDDTAKGIEYLQKSLELDPEHALSWVCLSEAYGNQAGWGWGPGMAVADKAREAAQRAVELAPDLAEAHVQLCHIHMLLDWDWRAAEVASRRALELAPSNPGALREAGVLAQHMRDLDKAADLLERALEQDPLSPGIYGRLGYLYRAMDRLPEALAAFRKSLELSPQRVTAYHLMANILAAQGQDAEAIAMAEREPADWARLTSLVVIHHLAGRAAESDKALARLRAEHSDDCALQIAAVSAVREETDAAFEWLERAHGQGDPGLPLATVEPAFRSIYGDPRWGAFLRKLGFDN